MPIKHYLAHARAWASSRAPETIKTYNHGLWLMRVSPNPLDIRNDTGGSWIA